MNQRITDAVLLAFDHVKEHVMYELPDRIKISLLIHVRLGDIRELKRNSSGGGNGGSCEHSLIDGTRGDGEPRPGE